ncbi:hypothetical protein GWI33_022870 [Rhynchophorus ferrugineus]|uniref:Uncharacterized protein n=1 Tax=Rhynchophorus ferrugineus TaxID=354439 RepID=A0A834IMV0_RHYFE|nr:hypothetical protein GWI33_022870 [Rhynchophorus ferrugineus]
MSTEDGERSGRPKEVATDENVKKIHKMIFKDNLEVDVSLVIFQGQYLVLYVDYQIRTRCFLELVQASHRLILL